MTPRQQLVIQLAVVISIMFGIAVLSYEKQRRAAAPPCVASTSASPRLP